MRRYYLAGHVHACLVGGHAVFLDLKNDSYLTIPTEFTAFIEPLVLFRSLDLYETDDFSLGSAHFDLIRDLENCDLISLEPQKMIIPQINKMADAVYDVDGESAVKGVSVNLRMIYIFIKSFILSIIKVKILGFRRTLSSSLTKRSRLSMKSGDLSSDIMSFREIRSFFYKSKDKCYFDCAVLFNYLAELGHDPRWVFGVTAPDFKAHCWIQVGNTVASEYIVTTSRYTPIMIV